VQIERELYRTHLQKVAKKCILVHAQNHFWNIQELGRTQVLVTMKQKAVRFRTWIHKTTIESLSWHCTIVTSSPWHLVFQVWCLQNSRHWHPAFNRNLPTSCCLTVSFFLSTQHCYFKLVLAAFCQLSHDCTVGWCFNRKRSYTAICAIVHSLVQQRWMIVGIFHPS